MRLTRKCAVTARAGCSPVKPRRTLVTAIRSGQLVPKLVRSVSARPGLPERSSISGGTMTTTHALRLVALLALVSIANAAWASRDRPALGHGYRYRQAPRIAPGGRSAEQAVPRETRVSRLRRVSRVPQASTRPAAGAEIAPTLRRAH